MGFRSSPTVHPPPHWRWRPPMDWKISLWQGVCLTGSGKIGRLQMTVNPEGKHYHLYHFSAERHLLQGAGVCVCPHTQAPCMHLSDQCCNKHPCTWALRWRLSFLWNRFPGVGLLGQRAYVFLISMDFSWLISKKVVIIYIFTSND